MRLKFLQYGCTKPKSRTEALQVVSAEERKDGVSRRVGIGLPKSLANGEFRSVRNFVVTLQIIVIAFSISQFAGRFQILY